MDRDLDASGMGLWEALSCHEEESHPGSPPPPTYVGYFLDRKLFIISSHRNVSTFVKIHKLRLEVEC